MSIALAKLEESNTSLEGVLTHIDFMKKVGQNKIADKGSASPDAYLGAVFTPSPRGDPKI